MRSAFFVLSGFILGIVIGLQLRKSKHSEISPSISNTKSAEQTTKPQPQNSYSDKISKKLKQFHDAIAQNYFLESGETPELAASDYRDFFILATKSPPLTGYDYTQLNILQNSFSEWYKLDPEDALNWLTQLPSQRDRNELATKLISDSFAQDVSLGMNLLKEFKKRNPNYVPSFDALRSASQHSTEAYLELLTLSIADRSSGIQQSSSSGSYAPDFNFQEALEHITHLRRNFTENQVFGISNYDLISEWSKRSPQQAIDWLTTQEKPPHDGFKNFIKGYAPSATSHELGEFIGDLHHELNDSQLSFQLLQTSLSVKQSKDVVSSFATNSKLPITEVVETLLTSGNFPLGSNPFDDFSGSIPLLSFSAISSEERQTLLKQPNIQQRLEQDNYRKTIEEALSSLGLTQEEISAELELKN